MDSLLVNTTSGDTSDCADSRPRRKKTVPVKSINLPLVQQEPIAIVNKPVPIKEASKGKTPAKKSARVAKKTAPQVKVNQVVSEPTPLDGKSITVNIFGGATT